MLFQTELCSLKNNKYAQQGHVLSQNGARQSQQHTQYV